MPFFIINRHRKNDNHGYLAALARMFLKVSKHCCCVSIFSCVLAIGDRKLDFRKRIIRFGTKSIYLCRQFLEAITQSHFGKEVFFHSHHIPIPV